MIEIQDDGEPPSLYRENYETGEVFDRDGTFSEYLSIVSLNAYTEQIFNQYRHLADEASTYDDDTVLVKNNVTLRRRIVAYRGRADDGEIFEKNIQSYFYIEHGEGGGYCRSWTSVSERINWCDAERRFEPASSVQDRLSAVFPNTEIVKEAKKVRFGMNIIRRMFVIKTSSITT